MIDGEDEGRESEVLELEEGQDLPEEQVGQAEEEDELVVSFGDEGEEQPSDSDLVRHLRQQLRERDKREAEAKAVVTPVDPGPKPTLAECDYDEEVFERRLEKWKDDSRAAQSAESQAEENRRKANEAWQQQLTQHYEKATKLPIKIDAYKAAEQNIVSTLSIEQQSAIVRYSKDSAKLILALDRQPAQLAELAKTSDAGSLVYKIAELDGKLKMTTKRKAPPPEEHVRGSASLENIGTDKRLEKLEKEADRTGDRSKVIAYKRSLKSNAA